MPVTLKFDPTQNSIQSQTINDATVFNDGVMSAGMVRALLASTLPPQTGNAGKFLETDGTNLSWQPAGGGSEVTPTTVKTSAYNAHDGDLVRCNPTGGTFTVTLPAAASSSIVIVKNQSNSATGITIAAAGGSTVDGAATFVMVNPRSSVTLYSDRVSDWMIT